jgi:hypothetical protein
MTCKPQTVIERVQQAHPSSAAIRALDFCEIRLAARVSEPVLASPSRLPLTMHYPRHLLKRAPMVPASVKSFDRGLRGLHVESGNSMKLCSMRVASSWLEVAGSGPQQAEGEPPDKERVHSSGHDPFP